MGTVTVTAGRPGSSTLLRRPATLQIIGQDIRQPNTGLGLTTALETEGRVPFGPYPWPVTELRMRLSGKYLTSAFAVANIPKTHTVKLAVEKVDGVSTTAPSMLFAGASSKAVVAGEASSLSDDWVASNGQIIPYTPCQMKYNLTVATAGIVTAPDLSQARGLSGPYAATCQWYASGATNPNNVNTPGPISTSGASGNQLAPPQMITSILGKFDYLRDSAFIIWNSKGTGTGTGVTTDQFSGKSHVSRALFDLRVPSASVALAGTTVQQWANVDSEAYALLAYANNALIGDCVNDAVTNLSSVVQIQGFYTTLIAKLRAINPTANIFVAAAEPATTTESMSVSSLTSIATAATLTLSSVPSVPFAVDDTIVVTGAVPTAYNGTFKLISAAGAVLGYTFAGGTSPATGTPLVTDGFTTLERQTFQPGAEWPNGVTWTVGAWLLTQVGSGLNINGVLDGNLAVATNGKWKFKKTLDGLHETDQAYTDESQLFKPQLIAGGMVPNTGNW